MVVPFFPGAGKALEEISDRESGVYVQSAV